jgi:hypothetical protein
MTLGLVFAAFATGLLLGYLGRPTREAIMEDHISEEALNNILRMEGRKGYC